MEVLLGGVGSTPMNVGITTRKTDFAPRVGVAYRLNERTVARAGYGLTYNPLPFARPLRGFYPLTVANNYVTTNTWQARGRLEDGIPEFSGPERDDDRLPLPKETAMRSPAPDNVHRGHIQSWNVAIERRLPLNLSVTTAYVGTKTTRGYANRELNVSPPGGGENGRRFFAQFGRTAATAEWGGITRSNYHALQLALDRPFKGGLFLKGQYTFSKALNMADEDGWVDVLFNSDAQFERNYARAGFDRPHNFSIGFSYALPFGADDRRSPIAAVVKDWQVNGTFQAYSGEPFTVTASNSALNQRGDQQTADLVGDLVWLGPSLSHPLYELSAFRNMTEARYGNMGRNALRGPGHWNYNMSLFRSFPLSNRTRLQFRIEGFALGNNPRWRNPATDQRNVGNANFLKLTEVVESGTRNVRLGVRLSF